MGKIMKTGRNRWLNVAIWAFSITAIVVVGLLILSWRDLLEIGASELLRLLTFCVGGIGAAIGLKIAIERQDKFSEQVQVQIDQVQVQVDQMQVQADQSFNDRLGRGVELLADEKNVVMRCAGVRVLIDLANNAGKEQKSLIVSIIYDFFCEKARIKYSEDGERLPLPENDSRRDLQDALDFILNLPLGEREELNRKLNLFDDDKNQLHFKGIDFTRLNFLHVHLENVSFSGCYFYKTTFDVAGMVNVLFSGGEIEHSSFGSLKPHRCPDTGNVIFYKSQWKISKSNFHPKSIKNSGFCGVKIEETSFFFLEMGDGVTFNEIEFWRGFFCVKNGIRVSDKESLPHFIGTHLAFEMIDFTNGLKAKDFFESCYYFLLHEAGKGFSQPKYIPIDPSRAVEFIGWDIFFIKPAKGRPAEDWSGQPVDEWVAVECAQHKLKQAKEEDIASLQRELEQDKKSLRKTQEKLNLPKRTPKPPNH